uniref:hypothetical protein n=1 Tax=Candidatus Fimivicinus sp. TaxID=3056640 RepID=UPI003FEFB078
MTELQNMMLSVCFGGMVGFFIAEIGILLYDLVSYIRRKHRERKEAKAEKQQSK